MQIQCEGPINGQRFTGRATRIKKTVKEQKLLKKSTRTVDSPIVKRRRMAKIQKLKLQKLENFDGRKTTACKETHTLIIVSYLEAYTVGCNKN